MNYPPDVKFVATVYPDWSLLEINETGDIYAFNRGTGKVYCLPHPDAPFIPNPWRGALETTTPAVSG